MRILYVTADYENVQPSLMKVFRELGNESFLFYYEIQNKIKKTDYPDFVSLGTSGGRARGPVFYKYKLNKAVKQCLALAEKIKPDVIHGNMTFCDGYIARKVSEKLNIPYVVSVKNTDVNNRFLWKLPHLKKMGLENLRLAKSVVFLSLSTKKNMLSKLPDELRENVETKARVIPNGIDKFYLENSFARVKSGTEFEKRIELISVGRVKRVKNIEAVTEAAEILIRDGWQVKLTVAGDIGDEFYRELFASKYFVNYVGKKKKEELINYYRDADVFVLPSHKETFGLVYAEAMSQGLPVIYTRGQGFDGQFDDGEVGYAVSDTDPAEIAEKIKLIVADYENVSKRCTERSLRYKWATVASRLIEECYKRNN